MIWKSLFDSAWIPAWDQDDAEDVADSVPDQPNIWSHGSREPSPHLEIEVAGAGIFAHLPSYIFDSNQWGHAQHLDVRFVLQTVQRTEYWGVMLAVQAFSDIHLVLTILTY